MTTLSLPADSISTGHIATGADQFCGVEPYGVADLEADHKLNSLRLNRSSTDELHLSGVAQPRDAEVGNDGDIALIEDRGGIIIPPNPIDLKKTGIVFTPDDEGYRISVEKVKFVKRFDHKLTFFFGIGNELGDFDNGFRDVGLPARFTFYGNSYDLIYVGINGYITFGFGDNSARPSPSALATQLPRIAPLWADLNITHRGEIFYARLEDRHLITWRAVPEGNGKPNTFQVSLYDDGRITFFYKKAKVSSCLVGLSPGARAGEGVAIDMSNPPQETLTDPFFETFSQKKRLDVPALTRAFYGRFPDSFDTLYIWTDFSFDNGSGLANAFNVRNDVTGIGLPEFDRGGIFGSPERLSSIVVMGNISKDWPSNPDAHVVGLFTASSILCHEFGHRWLAYVRFDEDKDIKDYLLGRQRAHWSFLADTRTTATGTFSSCMEGNSWRDNGNGTFTTFQTAANHFSDLDLYLMGLLPAGQVGPLPYLSVDEQSRAQLRSGSPVAGFSIGAIRKTAAVAQIIQREGPRSPDFTESPKEFRVAFIILTEEGQSPSGGTMNRMNRYRDALSRYFSAATSRRASIDTALLDAPTVD